MNRKQYLLTGGYNEKKGGGISCYEWDREKEELRLCWVEEACDNPSFLAMHPSGNIIYAGNEINEEARITAHRFCRDTGRIEFINGVRAEGAGMCHLTLNKAGTAIYGGDYTSGNIVAFQVSEDGSLLDLLSNTFHTGSGFHERQEGPHVHQLLLDEGEKHLIAVDFGLDALVSYEMDKRGGILEESRLISPMPEGEGPRHMVFSPCGKQAYVLTELGCKVLCCSYDRNTGAFACLKSLSLLSDDSCKEGSLDVTGAEILYAPGSHLLYTSLRGRDEIIVIDTRGGSGMEILRRYPSFGQMPRMFSFDGRGEYLFIANQQSGNVAVLRLSGECAVKCAEVQVPDVSFALPV